MLAEKPYHPARGSLWSFVMKPIATPAPHSSTVRDRALTWIDRVLRVFAPLVVGAYGLLYAAALIATTLRLEELLP